MCYPERRGLVSLCGVKAACSGDLCTGNGHRGKNWSLDILSRAFFNGPELTSRISRFAPDQLTQATGESKLPSLAKEVDAPSSKWSRSFDWRGRGGSFNFQ